MGHWAGEWLTGASAGAEEGKGRQRPTATCRWTGEASHEHVHERAAAHQIRLRATEQRRRRGAAGAAQRPLRIGPLPPAVCDCTPVQSVQPAALAAAGCDAAAVVKLARPCFEVHRR